MLAFVHVTAVAAASISAPGVASSAARARASWRCRMSPVMAVQASTPWESQDGSRGPNQYVRRGELVRGMMLPQPKTAFVPPNAEDDPVTPMIYAIAHAGDDRKARGICALRVSALTSVTTYFVTMTGKTRTQVNAIGVNVRDELNLKFGRDTVPQGDPASGWVVLDYGEAMVHIFTPEVKRFYELEKLWKNGQPLRLDGIVSPEGLTEAADEESEFEGFGLEQEEPEDDIWDDGDEDIWG
jgi:ribosome-associated protein